MLNAQPINHDNWQDFCRTFSRQHRGWRVRVGRVDTGRLEDQPQQAEDDMQVLEDASTFEGLAVEPCQNGERLLVLTHAGHSEQTHRVEKPAKLYEETADAGSRAGLRIDDDHGRTTLLRFRVAADPQDLDGLSEVEAREPAHPTDADRRFRDEPHAKAGQAEIRPEPANPTAPQTPSPKERA